MTESHVEVFELTPIAQQLVNLLHSQHQLENHKSADSVCDEDRRDLLLYSLNKPENKDIRENYLVPLLYLDEAGIVKLSDKLRQTIRSALLKDRTSRRCLILESTE